MEFSSKCYLDSGQDKTIYQGILTTGEPIVFINGIVDREDCKWALDAIEELIESGQREIVFDCGGVINVAQSWFKSQVLRRESESGCVSKIQIRDFQTDESASSYNTAPLPAKKQRLNTFAPLFNKLFSPRRVTSPANE